MTFQATARRRATLFGIASLWAALVAAPAAAHTVFLRAGQVDVLMPDGTTTVRMWGYAIGNSAEEANAAPLVSPGPAITVPVGDETLVVNLINALPVPTSFVLHGQNATMTPVFTSIVDNTPCTPGASLACRVRSFTHEAAPAGTAQYVYRKLKAGTYFYQSGTLPQVQVQMGLVGMLRKNAQPPASPDAFLYAYDNVPFDHEVAVVLSEVDPALHAAVTGNAGNLPAGTSTLNYAPKYFRLHRYLSSANGAAPEEITATPTSVPLNVPSGQRLLLRALNAGLQSRSLMIDDGHWHVVAEDGGKFPYAREQYSVLLAAAKTADLWFTPVVGTDLAPRVLTAFDRRLDLTNNNADPVGGMLAQLKVMNFAGGPTVTLSGCAATATQGMPYLGCTAVATGGTAPLALTLDAAPAGMTIDATGAIAWTPTNAQAQRPANPTLVNPIVVRVTDSNGVWATAGTNVAVANVNDAPVAANDTASTYLLTGTAANDQLTLTGNVLANDNDPDGDPLTAVNQANGAGVLAGDTLTLIPATGAFTFTATNVPASGSRIVSYTYQARDPQAALSAPATITLQLFANRAPVANADAATVPTGASSVDIDVAANDTDPDNNLKNAAGNLLNTSPSSITVTAPLKTAFTQPTACDDTTAAGTVNAVTVNGKRLVRYQRPQPNNANSNLCLNRNGGTVTFTVQVRDQMGAQSGAATVTLRVLPR
jgi:hypothetical protein